MPLLCFDFWLDGLSANTGKHIREMIRKNTIKKGYFINRDMISSFRSLKEIYMNSLSKFELMSMHRDYSHIS